MCEGNVLKSESQLSPHFLSLHDWQRGSLRHFRPSPWYGVHLCHILSYTSTQIASFSDTKCLYITTITFWIDSISRFMFNVIMDVLIMWDDKYIDLCMCVCIHVHLWIMYITVNPRVCSDPKVRSAPSQQDNSIYHWETGYCRWAADDQSARLQPDTSPCVLWPLDSTPLDTIPLPPKAEVPVWGQDHN